jgi:hypothetical protein
MLFLTDAPVNLNDKLTYAVPVPTPVGEPSFGLRLGYAQADTSALLGGADITIPISTGVRLFAIRGDFDYWRDNSGSSKGGDAGSVLAIFGPSSSYFGGGVSVASRYGGASGPSGSGFKFVYGSRFLPVVGYEFDAIVTGKGTVGAALVTLHF